MYSDRLLRTAMASKLAYAKTKKNAAAWPVSTQLHGNSDVCAMSKIIDIKATGSHAYVWKTGSNSLMISFRGSHDLTDLYNMSDIVQKPFHFRQYQSKIHSGVLTMFESIEEELSKEISWRHNNGERINHLTFCGHSLGGALAHVSSAYYGALYNNRFHITCHSYGAPKVGDVQFRAFHEANVNESINVITDLDPVPSLLFFDSYVAVGEMLTLKSSTWNPIYAHDLDVYMSKLSDHTRNLKMPH